MSNIPSELKYTNSHEWVNDNGDGTVTIGITDHAQAALGDVVFVELPELDTEFEAQEECGVVESVKAASDIYAPVAGKVVEVNEALEEDPEIINNDPYDNGWIYKLQITDATQLDSLLDAAAYEEETQE